MKATLMPQQALNGSPGSSYTDSFTDAEHEPLAGTAATTALGATAAA
jgi:hypothetical protein